MKMTLVGIFDRKAQCFISLEPTPAIGVAVRQFTEVVNKQSDNPIHKWPADFELYELGEWDSETGYSSAREDEARNYQKRLIVTGDSVKAN